MKRFLLVLAAMFLFATFVSADAWENGDVFRMVAPNGNSLSSATSNLSQAAYYRLAWWKNVGCGPVNDYSVHPGRYEVVACDGDDYCCVCKVGFANFKNFGNHNNPSMKCEPIKFDKDHDGFYVPHEDYVKPKQTGSLNWYSQYPIPQPYDPDDTDPTNPVDPNPDPDPDPDPNDPVELSIPEFEEIPTQEIDLFSGPIYHLVDLWNFASDEDDPDFNLTFNFLSQSTAAVINCSLNDLHFVSCSAPLQEGSNLVTVKVTDPDGQYDTETFRINVTEPVTYAPKFRSIPNKAVDITSGQTTHMFDLWSYVSDSDTQDSQLSFTVLSESNTSKINCYINDLHFFACHAPSALGTSLVTVKATDPQGNYDTETFEVEVYDPVLTNNAPVISGLPNKTIGITSGHRAKLVTLSAYATDDTTASQDLIYTITGQTDSSVIECFIEDDYHLSCFAPGKAGYTDVTIEAEDEYGRTDEDTMRITVVQGQGPGGINTYANTDTVYISPNGSIAVGFTVENTSSETECVNFDSETSSVHIDADTSINSFCLPAHSQTSLSLSIFGLDAPISSYTATLVTDSDFGTATYAINVVVYGDAEVEIIPFGRDVCRGETDYVSVLIKNNSNELKDVRLWADNEIILPYFDPEEITLDAFEEQYVKVYISTSRNTLLGDYDLSLFAEFNGGQTKEMASVDVKDCLEEDIDFTLSLSSSCQYTEKNEEEKISYTINNLGEEEIELRVAVLGDLPTEYDSTIRLEGEESQTFDIYVTPRNSDSIGSHELEINVWNRETGKSFEKTKCIYVRKAEASSTGLLENDLEIAQCTGTVFTLLVKNEGDTDIDYRISELDDLENDSITVTISDKRFELRHGEQKYVYLSVNTTEDTPLGRYEFDIRIRADGTYTTETLRFSVVEESTIEGMLSIVSFPVQATVDENGQTAVYVTVKNGTDEDAEDVLVEFVNLPTGLEASSAFISRIPAGTAKQVMLLVENKNAEEGVHKVQLEARSSQFIDVKETELVVPAKEKKEENNGQDQFLLGLILAGEDVLFGILFLAAIITLILLASKFVRDYKNPNESDQVWLRRG